MSCSMLEEELDHCIEEWGNPTFYLPGVSRRRPGVLVLVVVRHGG